MHIFETLDSIKPINNSVLTIGSFDGIHIGHSKLISRLIYTSNFLNSPSVLITFDPLPKQILRNDDLNFENTLMTLENKINILANFNIDYLLVLKFDVLLSKMKALDFLQNIILKNFNPNTIVLGYDHQFGYNREGDKNFLKKYSKKFNYKIDTIPEQCISDEIISSTAIKNYVKSGNLEKANRMLGYQYQIIGTVVKGNKIGRKLNYPTANIRPKSKQILPKIGVYKVIVIINGKEYIGMCNIGYSPTFNGKNKRIEVNIISDFTFQLYGQIIKIKFVRFIREELKFKTVKSLVKQLQNDEIECLKN